MGNQPSTQNVQRQDNRYLYIILGGLGIIIVGLIIAIILVSKQPTVELSAGDYNDKIIELKENCGESCSDEILKYAHEAYQKYQDAYTAISVCRAEELYGTQESAEYYCKIMSDLLEASRQEDTL